MKIMKKIGLLMIVPAFLTPVLVHAASQLEQEVDAEINSLYNSSGSAQAQVKPAVQVEAPRLKAKSDATSARPLSVKLKAQAQPKTFVAAKAKPKKTTATVVTAAGSASEQTRRAPKDLFDDQINRVTSDNKDLNTQADLTAKPTEDALVIERADLSEMNREALRGEVDAAMAEMKSEETSRSGRLYVGALAGISSYQNLDNVTSRNSGGVEIGYITADRVAYEASFIYGQYSVTERNFYTSTSGNSYNRETDMDQMNFNLAGKYQLTSGMIRPVIGAVAAYTFRSYKDRNNMLNAKEADAKSDAIDAGLVAGADVELTSKISLGVDFKYYWNLGNKSERSDAQAANGSYYYASGKKSTRIEQFSYYNLGLVGKMSF